MQMKSMKEIASKESKAEVSELFQYVKWVWGEFAIKTTKSKNHGERKEMFYPCQILVPFGLEFALKVFFILMIT